MRSFADDLAVPSRDPGGGEASRRAPGKRTLTMGLVQRKVEIGRRDASPETIDEAAERGVTTSSGSLPHRDAVQASFGRHRIDHVQAHTGSDAADTAAAMNAEAYAVGDHVVFGSGLPTLHTVAHEAAHVIQQRAGVARKGGGDQDVFERHADAVADAVVAGRSAELLLDEVAGPEGSTTATSPTVQRIIKYTGSDAAVAPPEHKGTRKGVVTKQHNNQQYIYTYANEAHLRGYIDGSNLTAPVRTDNPAYGAQKDMEVEPTTEEEGDGGGAAAAPAAAADPGIYDRGLTLQTTYLTLTIQHPTAGFGVRIPESKVGEFAVGTFEATAHRPPTNLAGGGQGQHKVAWRAIWGALARCRGQALEAAHATMDQIITLGGCAAMVDQKPDVKVVMGRPSPARADALIAKAHNYLVARQLASPAWASTDAKQLSGKGERSLGIVLHDWQSVAASASAAVVRAILDQPDMNKLFDATGRANGEVDDVIGRARRELQIHNPAAFAAHTAVVDAWLLARRPAAPAAAAGAGADDMAA